MDGRFSHETYLNERQVHEKFPLCSLDPTQRAFADRVLEWARQLVHVYKKVEATGQFHPIPILRSYLCGSAGSGKSTTIKAIVQHVRLLFQKEQVDAQIELTAYTGVAAFNIGFGAKTACSAFQIFPKAAWKSELDGEACKRLERTWSNVVLLIVDEISFIGRAFFWRMHCRLQQGRRRHFSESALDPNDYIFGDISIILVGDFGQLEPIDDWSMCDSQASYHMCPKKMKQLWGHNVNCCRKLMPKFREAVMLHEIHRSRHDMWWTESCLRLRDFAMTWEDWNWWRQHDLDRGHLTPEQKDYFDNKAVWLCARCEDVGQRNGRKLAQLAEKHKEVIHQIRAQHSSKSARKLASTAFDGLRDVINLVQGCKVMLARNVAYQFGLANGTRGTLVGLAYGPGGIGTFPEAIIVEFLDYRGEPFYPAQPKWVPILPMTSYKEGTRMTRTQFPLVAGFALTVNKAQGLTIKEGTVINLAGSQRFRPASKHGLPFVAFTRSESFAMTAFKNLPPWDDFTKGCDSDMLHMRLEFTSRLEEMHRRTLARHSAMKTRGMQEEAHQLWRESQVKRHKENPPAMICAACAEAGL